MARYMFIARYATEPKALSRPAAAPAAPPSRRWPKGSALAVNSTGHTSVRTVVLMTPEDVDAAAKQTVTYIPPGA